MAKKNRTAAPKKTGFKVTHVKAAGRNFNSVGRAFKELKLPSGRLIRFRMALKEAGKLVFEHGRRRIAFQVVA